MEDKYILGDTAQIKRLKKYALFYRYSCSGEVYKLLSLRIGHQLAKKIPKGKIKLKSNLLYGKCYISLEENFISILEKYVEYVRNNYFIFANELVIILEQTLKNMYSNCLYCDYDVHDYPDLFLNRYSKLFLANLVYNTRYYARKDTFKECIGIQKANAFLKNKQLNDQKDLKEIERFFIDVINNYRHNLCNAFVPHSEINEKQIYFYMQQLNWIYEDYYKKRESIFKEYN